MGWFCPRCGHQADAEGRCPHDGDRLARVSSHDLLGRKVGEYLILATIGGGSYGSVYRAIHERSGMMVAIKLLHRPIDDVESQRVIVEARAAAMLEHPNLGRVYDLSLTSDRRPYIVMQLLDGKPLSAVIRQGLDVATAVSIANDVLAALSVAHTRGVIHRDLKPDNIFITKGRALIVDFGLAKLVADPRSPSLTATGEALGTPAYMAPEQIRGEATDGRTDLYAVGCVLFEMLAGRPPYEGSATYALFDAHLHQPVPSITALRRDIPPAIEIAISRALAKSPGGRFESAGEMQRALAGTTPRRAHRPLAIVAAAALAALVSVGIVLAVTRGGEPAAAEPAVAEGVPPPPRKIAVPSPLAGEPPLDPRLENTLTAAAEMYSTGQVRRIDLVTLRCQIQLPPPQAPADIRAYYRRYEAMLADALPDFDRARECHAPPPPPPKRFARPDALPDEGAPDPHLEDVIATIHDQLDANRLTFAQAVDMHCDFASRHREANQAGTGLPRTVRSLYRRIDVLLEAYHPRSTHARCPR